jgi:hypothetical protein
VTATYMNLPAWSIPVLKSTLFQQTAPLIVLFLIPALLIWLSTHLRRIFSHNFIMGIESWGFSLPWLWSSQSDTSTSRRKSKRKNSQSGAIGSSPRHKAPRTHAEQIALNAVGENDNSGMSFFAFDRTRLNAKSKQINQYHRNPSGTMPCTILVSLISLERIAS